MMNDEFDDGAAGSFIIHHFALITHHLIQKSNSKK